MKTRFTYIFAFLALSLSGTCLLATTRTWTSAAGTTMEAELVKTAGNEVTLKTADGRVINVKLNQLSAEDQAFVTSKQQLTAKPTVKAEVESNKKEFHRIRFEPPSAPGMYAMTENLIKHFKIKLNSKQEKAFETSKADGVVRDVPDVTAMVGIKTTKVSKKDMHPDVHTFIQNHLNDKIVYIEMKNGKKTDRSYLTGYTNSRKIYDIIYIDNKAEKISFEEFEAQVDKVLLFSVDK